MGIPDPASICFPGGHAAAGAPFDSGAQLHCFETCNGHMPPVGSTLMSC